MQTQCKSERIRLQRLESREIIADFKGGDITSDGGVMLMREVERATGIIDRFSECFADCRDERFIKHTLKEPLTQRIFGICRGYEDLSDHDELRRDPCFAVAVNQSGISHSTGSRPLAGKSTLNRMEHSNRTVRYHRISYDSEKVNRFFVDMFLESRKEGFSTDITGAAVICRCISSVVTACFTHS